MVGRTLSELYYVKDRDLNFYILGAMGQASSIGLGIAINTAKRVYVLYGDGHLLMNPNILCEIASLKPLNMTIIVLDNGTYSTTAGGGQKIASHDRFDLEKLRYCKHEKSFYKTGNHTGDRKF